MSALLHDLAHAIRAVRRSPAELNGRRVAVVGVTEEGSRGTRIGLPMVWIPIAAWPQARQAARINPMEALHIE